jgi:hypothetical protein
MEPFSLSLFFLLVYRIHQFKEQPFPENASEWRWEQPFDRWRMNRLNFSREKG